ncbi:Hypothetical_protein [Hexamita inflata]|uniref:Hypothetical_protein n=1 Tax=Hexamita inflata TaxID=28002 RepID=A0AA86N406_9EUKA|nr:Hypothetical protein HINF_LOCUS58 [Hexamita inflata]
MFSIVEQNDFVILVLFCVKYSKNAFLEFNRVSKIKQVLDQYKAEIYVQMNKQLEQSVVINSVQSIFIYLISTDQKALELYQSQGFKLVFKQSQSLEQQLINNKLNTIYDFVSCNQSSLFNYIKNLSTSQLENDSFILDLSIIYSYASPIKINLDSQKFYRPKFKNVLQFVKQNLQQEQKQFSQYQTKDQNHKCTVINTLTFLYQNQILGNEMQSQFCGYYITILLKQYQKYNSTDFVEYVKQIEPVNELLEFTQGLNNQKCVDNLFEVDAIQEAEFLSQFEKQILTVIYGVVDTNFFLNNSIIEEIINFSEQIENKSYFYQAVHRICQFICNHINNTNTNIHVFCEDVPYVRYIFDLFIGLFEESNELAQKFVCAKNPGSLTTAQKTNLELIIQFDPTHISQTQITTNKPYKIIINKKNRERISAFKDFNLHFHQFLNSLLTLQQMYDTYIVTQGQPLFATSIEKLKIENVNQSLLMQQFLGKYFSCIVLTLNELEIIGYHNAVTLRPALFHLSEMIHEFLYILQQVIDQNNTYSDLIVQVLIYYSLLIKLFKFKDKKNEIAAYQLLQKSKITQPTLSKIYDMLAREQKYDSIAEVQNMITEIKDFCPSCKIESQSQPHDEFLLNLKQLVNGNQIVIDQKLISIETLFLRPQDFGMQTNAKAISKGNINIKWTVFYQKLLYLCYQFNIQLKETTYYTFNSSQNIYCCASKKNSDNNDHFNTLSFKQQIVLQQSLYFIVFLFDLVCDRSESVSNLHICGDKIIIYDLPVLLINKYHILTDDLMQNMKYKEQDFLEYKSKHQDQLILLQSLMLQYSDTSSMEQFLENVQKFCPYE